jgi:fumarate reductase subunit C
MKTISNTPPLPPPNLDGMRQARAWAWQRLSAMVLALCVLVHIAVMIYAVRGGLSGAEILARTRGNLFFAGFYTVFVLACAVHVPIGLAAIAREWLAMSDGASILFAKLFGMLLLVLGMSAVLGVVA